MDGAFFNAWVKQFLARVVKPGQVVVMDNATFHEHQRTYDLDRIEGRKSSLL
jgi:predicted O-methyltransferase YrrM